MCNYPIGNKIVGVLDVNNVAVSVLKIWDVPGEMLGLICLDNGNRIVGVHEISRGISNQTAVYVSDIMRRALLNNASSIIIFHTHPGGSSNPSEDDWRVTSRIAECCKVMDISFADHVIIPEDAQEAFSMRSAYRWPK